MHNFQRIFRDHKKGCAASFTPLKAPRGHSYPTNYLVRVAGRFGFRPFLAVFAGVSPHQKKAKAEKYIFEKLRTRATLFTRVVGAATHGLWSQPTGPSRPFAPASKAFLQLTQKIKTAEKYIFGKLRTNTTLSTRAFGAATPGLRSQPTDPSWPCKKGTSNSENSHPKPSAPRLDPKPAPAPNFWAARVRGLPNPEPEAGKRANNNKKQRAKPQARAPLPSPKPRQKSSAKTPKTLNPKP